MSIFSSFMHFVNFTTFQTLADDDIPKLFVRLFKNLQPNNIFFPHHLLLSIFSSHKSFSRRSTHLIFSQCSFLLLILYTKQHIRYIKLSPQIIIRNWWDVSFWKFLLENLNSFILLYVTNLLLLLLCWVFIFCCIHHPYHLLHAVSWNNSQYVFSASICIMHQCSFALIFYSLNSYDVCFVEMISELYHWNSVGTIHDYFQHTPRLLYLKLKLWCAIPFDK